jgi:hypothetical protein
MPVQDKSSRKAQGTTDVRKPRSKFSKTDLRYWREVIFKPTYSAEGRSRQTDFWAVQIVHGTQRVRWSLHTDNREAAAARAREIYQYVIANGWDAARERFRPKHQAVNKTIWTVGEYLAASKKVCGAKPQTIEGYAQALRRIVSEVQRIGGGKAKFDYRAGGNAEWQSKIHSIRLETLTSAKIDVWKRRFVSTRSEDAILRRRATTSANSFLRRARALFSPRIRAAIRRELGVEPPASTPFDNVELLREPSHKYFSAVEIEKLIQSGRRELADADPEVFKVFLLATFAGLRRREIDLLEWSAINWERNYLRVQQTAYFTAKTGDSEAELPLDAEIIHLLRGYSARATGPFVIESSRAPKHDAVYQHYRCDEIFQRLVAWLRLHGVRSQKPLHELRKEFGSLINKNHGIHAASRALRHSDIRVTSDHYTDSRAQGTTGLGFLLGGNLTTDVRPQHDEESTQGASCA